MPTRTCTKSEKPCLSFPLGPCRSAAAVPSYVVCRVVIYRTIATVAARHAAHPVRLPVRSFTAQLPINHFRRVYLLVENGAPLVLALLASGYDDKMRPLPFTIRSVYLRLSP